MSMSMSYDAHTVGRCNITWDVEGSRIVSCGEDAKVNVYVPSRLNEKDDHGRIKSAFEGLNMKDKYVCDVRVFIGKRKNLEAIVAMEKGDMTNRYEGEVRIVNFPSGDMVKNLFEGVNGIRDVDLSPNEGDYCAIAHGQVINLVSTVDDLPFELVGHKGVVKCVRFSPDGKYLASAGCDGNVIVWKLQDRSIVQTIPNLVRKDLAEISDNNSLIALSWYPDRAKYVLAIPGQKSITIVNGLTGQVLSTLEGGHEEFTSMAIFSPNGQYIASTSPKEKTLKIWGYQNKNLVRSFSLDNPLYGLSWNPQTENSIVLIDGNGEMRYCENVIPKGMPHPAIRFSAAALASKASDESEDSSAAAADVEDIRNQVVRVNENHSKNFGTDIYLEDEDDAGVDDDDDDETKRGKVIIQQIEAKRVEIQPAFQSSATNNDLRFYLENEDDRDAQAAAVVEAMEEETYEEKRHFLVWNSHGMIIQRKDGEYSSSIEIEFSDSAKNRSIRFQDHHDFRFASLSSSGAAFASCGELPVSKTPKMDPTNHVFRGLKAELNALEEMEDQELDQEKPLMENENGIEDKSSSSSSSSGKAAQIQYRNFKSWTQNSEWTQTLPIGEIIQALACGESFLACATNKSLIRIFRPSGLQEPPIMIPGKVVNIIGCENLLLVIYQVSEPFADGTQCMNYQFLNLGRGGVFAEKFKTLSQGSIATPLGMVRALEWTGFTCEEMGLMPVVLDGAGLLLGLSEASGFQWIPLLDTSGPLVRKSQGEKCWPVSVRAGHLMTVMLRNHRVNPQVAPKPALVSFKLSIPIIGIVKETKPQIRYTMEEQSLRGSISLRQKTWASHPTISAMNVLDHEEGFDNIEEFITREEAKLDAEIVKHFVLSIKLGNLERAFGLAQRLRLPKSKDVALLQARKGNVDELVKKLEQLFHGDSHEEEEDDDDEYGENASNDEPKQQESNIPGTKKLKNMFADAIVKIPDSTSYKRAKLN